jgi:hypothetical protein
MKQKIFKFKETGKTSRSYILKNGDVGVVERRTVEYSPK